jgi:hypothetical protein
MLVIQLYHQAFSLTHHIDIDPLQRFFDSQDVVPIVWRRGKTAWFIEAGKLDRDDALTDKIKEMLLRVYRQIMVLETEMVSTALDDYEEDEDAPIDWEDDGLDELNAELRRRLQLD